MRPSVTMTKLAPPRFVDTEESGCEDHFENAIDGLYGLKSNSQVIRIYVLCLHHLLGMAQVLQNTIVENPYSSAPVLNYHFFKDDLIPLGSYTD